MQSRCFSDKQFTASTTALEHNVPLPIQADLGEDKFVTHVGTKGRFPELSPKTGQPTTKEEYVRKYRLFYRRRATHEWIPLGTYTSLGDFKSLVVNTFRAIN